MNKRIGSSVYCTLGRAYKDCNGANASAVNIDMIKLMIKDEVTGGDETIYSKGKYFFEM